MLSLIEFLVKLSIELLNLTIRLAFVIVTPLLRLAARYWYVVLPVGLIAAAVHWVSRLPAPWPWIVLGAVMLLVGVLIAAGIAAARRADEQRVAEERHRAVLEQEEAHRQAERDRHIEFVDAMTGPQFEELVARLLDRCGWDAPAVVGGAGDLGADVIAHDSTGRKLVVQCKRYAPHRSVGSADIQKVAGTHRHHHGADVSVVVTSSSFTDPATKFAAMSGIGLVDRSALGEWMRTGEAPEILRAASAQPAALVHRFHPVSGTALRTITDPRPVQAELSVTIAAKASEDVTLTNVMDFVCFTISRTDVEYRQIDPTLEHLSVLTSHPEVARHFCGRVDLAFAGYDHDTREIFEIRDVREFVQELDRRFPFLPYLLTRETATLRTLALCLITAEMTLDDNVRINSTELHSLATRWLGQVGQIARRTHRDIHERGQVEKEVEAYLLPI